jgi:hypothetical protein
MVSFSKCFEAVTDLNGNEPNEARGPAPLVKRKVFGQADFARLEVSALLDTLDRLDAVKVLDQYERNRLRERAIEIEQIAKSILAMDGGAR